MNNPVMHKRFLNKRRIALAVALLMLHCLSSSWADDVVLDRIRAVVNEGIVLESELTASIAYYKREAANSRQALPQDERVLTQRILEQLIEREVLRQHARQLGVAIDPGSINRAVEQIAQTNNLDTLRFRQTLQQQGMDYDLFRRNIEDELLRQRLIEREVRSRIRVSSQEIDDFVDAAKNDADENLKYRIQHILIAVPSAADNNQLTQAQKKADDILSRLNRNEDFAELAIAESDGARALQGGDLGWRTLQELPEFIATEIRGMKPGDYSQALRSANGLHLVRLAELQSGGLTQQAETLARHIFIAGDGPTIEERLRDIRQQLIAGASFASLAAEHSEDPNSASSGGELPWFTQGQMPPAMEQIADSLAINGLSAPFRTQFGWHLMQVIDRRTRTIDDDALRVQAENALSQRKLEQEIQRWSRQLRDESYVEIRS